jgi:ASCH domain
VRALTIRQPWASLIIAGEKDVENRTWPTRYRGPLAIHAGQGVDRDLQPWQRKIVQRINSFPRGAIIGIVDLTDIVRDAPSRWAESGHYHWVLTNPRPIEPIPLRERLGLWTPDVEIPI